MDLPDHLVPADVGNQRLQPFMTAPQERNQLRPTQGSTKTTFQTRKHPGDPNRAQRDPPSREETETVKR